MAKKKFFPQLFMWLGIVGAINWGLVALGFNLVTAIFGTGDIANIVYGLVGVSGLYALGKVLKVFK